MRRVLLAALALFALSECTTFPNNPTPAPEPIACYQKKITIYDIASGVTGAPADILRGIAFAESSCGLLTDHPDPLDVGWFGLHESRAYHIERAKKWGEYNASNPLDSAIITGFLYMENLKKLGDSDLAISAHLQGARGVLRDGPTQWYISRVTGK